MFRKTTGFSAAVAAAAFLTLAGFEETGAHAQIADPAATPSAPAEAELTDEMMPVFVSGEVVQKINEGRPNVLDTIVNRQVKLVINTPSARRDARADDASIRKAALKYKIPYLTTLAAASAAAQGIRAARDSSGGVKSIQKYHAGIR